MLRLRSAASAQEVVTFAEPYEPDTLRIIGDLADRGLGRDVRAWVVTDGDAIVGAVTVARLSSTRWYATPVVADPDAGPLLAGAVDESPAWEVTGGADHVAAVAPHLRRLRSVVDIDLVGARPMPMDFLESDPRCRVAGPGDLDALVEVYAEYELEETPTRRQLRAFLTRTMASRTVVVLEIEGRIAAAARCEFRTPRVDFWAGVTILPAFRRQKLYAPLNNTTTLLSIGANRATCGTLAPTNRTSPDRHPQAEGNMDLIFRRPWQVARLRSPNRFPGHRRARAAFERAEGRLNRRPPEIVR